MILLGALLALDLLLITFHLLRQNGWLSDDRFNIARDGGFGELLQYVKEGGVAALLWNMFRRTGSITTLAWAAGFAALLIDDALSVHESIGEILGPVLLPQGFAGLAPWHAVEFAVLGTGALCFLSLVTYAGTFEGRRERRMTLMLGGLLALLAVFGVGLDAVHSVARGSPWRPFLAIGEEGGEMIGVSALVATTWLLWSQTRAPITT